MTTTWNPSDKSSNITLSAGNLTAAAASSGIFDSNVRATAFVTTGQKRYWEVTLTNAGSGGGQDSYTGIANGSFTVTGGGLVGQDANSAGWRRDFFAGDTGVYFNISVVITTSQPAVGGVMCFAVDFAHSKLWVRLNGGTWNNSGTDDPATNTGGYTYSITGDLYPAVGLVKDTTSPQLTANFGATAFAQTAPSGFTGFDTSGTNVALTGQAGTSAKGTLAVSASVALTGIAATSGRGNVGTGIGLTGQAATSAKGTFGITADRALTGQAATGSPGTLAPAASRAITGTGLTAGQGAVAPALSVPLTGQAATSAGGTVSVVSGVTVALTGQAATVSAGMLAVTVSLPLSGSSGQLLAGILGFEALQLWHPANSAAATWTDAASVADPWTPQANPSATWANASSGGSIWTPQTPSTAPWTEE